MISSYADAKIVIFPYLVKIWTQKCYQNDILMIFWSVFKKIS